MRLKALNLNAYFLAVLLLVVTVFLLCAGSVSAKTALGGSEFSVEVELEKSLSKSLLALEKSFYCRWAALGICDGPEGSTTPHTSSPTPNVNVTPAQMAASEKLGVDPKWVNPDGRINWPENRGFDGQPVKVTMEPGATFDRYGGKYKDGKLIDTGHFVSPEGTPFDQRALPNSMLDKPYTRYEVVKTIPDVDSGKAAPWFDKPGGGTQMELPMSIDDLVEGGYIRPVN